MSAGDDDAPGADELIAAYADDPRSLTAAERRAVEARCAEDPAAQRMLAEARAALAALRQTAPPAVEPDWTAFGAQLRDAIAREPAPRQVRRRRGLVAAGAFAALAAIAVLLWQTKRPARPLDGARATLTDAAAAETMTDDLPTDEDLAAELAVPDDLGGITVDDELIDEAAALADEPHLPGDDDVPELDPLVPDGAWIDELSDEDLDRAIEWLAQEAG